MAVGQYFLYLPIGCLHLIAMNKESAYYRHLSKDKRLLPLLQTIQPRPLLARKNICLRLCASIMSQQLSIKVADVIFRRFLELYGGDEPTPQQILDTPHDVLRGIGLSNAKVSYVHNVAQYIIANAVTDDTFTDMSNEEVIAFLTPITGVGRWTVEMLLMFTLGREDVFAVDDLGIQQAMTKIYELDATDRKALRLKMLELSAAWQPYRTWACFYLWDYKDAK